MLKAFRYRLCPATPQEGALNEQLHLCRNLYNNALQERRDAYREAGKTVIGYDKMKYLTETKVAFSSRPYRLRKYKKDLKPMLEAKEPE